ncbi:1,4-alpha-glucan branching enzyme [Williamsia limnetica]|uniref:1,4-alpha-glucan branching enzyme n=1 Tax=Williamsia limnetica TaxID=882452 RepID=A0A318RZ05_WILLI|nr:glycoside hydrolase family 57 protein [Williamsia limnetica]PYE15594.1 1,4-alpha-glucan branching enzyme [Williamsia limnetica]
MFSLVLHSHLPWLANHGRWPVGEEWLYQSWAGSYQPVFAALRRLAADGFTDQLSLGVTPVLAAQLDDPHCLSSMHQWLGDWQLRASEAAVAGDEAGTTARSASTINDLGLREYRSAAATLVDFETHWRHGGSALIRSMVDAGTIELLGGPLAHPFGPLLDPRLRDFSLREGLADSQQRFGATPAGIWAPECAYAPGMETDYQRAGVGHFMVDGPALHGDTSLGRPVHESDVVAFGRDLQVSYRVWSPKSGYPGHPAYRDFHTYDHLFGLKPARVTGRGVAGADKKPYEPQRTQAVLSRHVADFVDCVRARLIDESARIGRGALVVAAFDTELFGHWWHEGPQWLEAVLRALPEAGIRVGTLRAAREQGFVGAPAALPKSSWGSGKDWRVWNGPEVEDLVQINAEVVQSALATVDKRRGRGDVTRDRVSDQILREALLTASSDWPFMVSKDTAADYARNRMYTHAHATREICDAADRGREGLANDLSARWNIADNLFAGLDARRMGAV